VSWGCGAVFVRPLFLSVLVASALLLRNHAAAAGVAPPGPTEPPPPEAGTQSPEILVQAPEPRYVAPTLRDRIGRIWAPVFINGRGPFRMVLDTGASDFAITAPVAVALELVPSSSHVVLVQGVAGSAIVPTVQVDSLSVGDLDITSATLPIIADALGGAEGVLGTAGFSDSDKRIDIDFRHDRIAIVHSHGQHAPLGFITLPLERSGPGLLMVSGSVAQVHVHAVIDTGAERSIGNEALRRALVSRHAQGTPDKIYDVTTHVQGGEMFESPPIMLGKIEIHGARITYGEVRIFEHWQLTHEPALLIGMDALGLLDELIIDYRRRELELRTR
jgi:predicted aspartyl protease